MVVTLSTSAVTLKYWVGTKRYTGGSHLSHTSVKPDSCLSWIFAKATFHINQSKYDWISQITLKPDFHAPKHFWLQQDPPVHNIKFLVCFRPFWPISYHFQSIFQHFTPFASCFQPFCSHVCPFSRPFQYITPHLSPFQTITFTHR